MERFNKRAEAGIGTLILFIAMILVAAVAAGVLIQTSSSLQSKALATGSKAKTQVSTQVAFNLVYGEDGADNVINEIFAELKLVPGSDPIKINDSLVEFILKNNSRSFSNNGSKLVGACEPPVYATYGQKFETLYIVQGASFKQDYLHQGDVVQICFQSPQDITEDEEFRLQFIPKSGAMSQILANTPDVMASVKVELFP